MPTELKASFGPWMVKLTPGEIGIVDRDGNTIALVEEIGNAAIMATAKEMLEALINLHEMIQVVILEDDIRELLEGEISIPIEKIVAESDI